MPVNPYEYNTRPVRNIYQNAQYADTLAAVLSKENYLSPSPDFCSPDPERLMDDNSSYGSSSPSPSFEGQRYYCGSSNCAYSVIGYPSVEELQMHMAEGKHFDQEPEEQEEINIFGWTNTQGPTDMLPEIQPFAGPQSQQACPCQYCTGYQPEMQMYAPGSSLMHVQMPLPPTIVGYNGPEVENLSWGAGEIRPPGAYPAKRQRFSY